MTAFLLSMLGVGRSVMSAVMAWLSRRSLAEIGCICLALFAVIQTARVSAEHRQNVKLKAQIAKCNEARKADQDAYTKAQVDAAAANKAQVQKVERQYQRNSDDERQAYLRDLAELGRMRSQPPAAPGSAGATIAPPSPAPTQGADGNELHLSADEHLQASEIELRLFHLQNWVERQLGVDPNQPEPSH